MKILKCVSFFLLVIGGLNWGLVGLFDFNLVSTIFGSMPILEKLIYILVGISAVLALFCCKKCKHCESGSSTTP